MLTYCKYPFSLMPFKGLLKEVLVDSLLEQGNDFGVARRIDDDLLSCICDLGQDVKVIPMSYIVNHLTDAVDMSMNILSETSGVESLSFIQSQQPACSPWNGTNVNINDCKDFLNHRSNVHCLVYRASNFHKQPGTYTRTYNDRKSFELDQAIEQVDKQFSKQTSYSRSFQLHLHHKPSNCNYWHITLDIVAPYNEKNLKILKKKKWLLESNLLKIIWSRFLSRGFCLDKNPYLPIPIKKFYDRKVNFVHRLFYSYLTKRSLSKVKILEI